MRKYSLILLMSLTSFIAGAQEDGEYKEASKTSKAYREYRLYESVPPYGLKKVQGLISKIVSEDKEMEDGGTAALDTKTYNTLSFREKFTYHMIHGETYSQICDVFPPLQDEEKKIFGYLPDILREDTWSENQKVFFKNNKDSVMALIKECVIKSNRVGVNFKRAIIEMNAVEMIPFLISTYNKQKKDGDILTLLNLLMLENKYDPFLKSATHNKLYTEEHNYTAFITFNKANEELIIKRANEFYTSVAKR